MTRSPMMGNRAGGQQQTRSRDRPWTIRSMEEARRSHKNQETEDKPRKKRKREREREGERETVERRKEKKREIERGMGAKPDGVSAVRRY